MMIKKIKILVLFLSISQFGFSQTNSFTQFWLEAGGKAKIKEINISFAEGIRFSEGSLAQSYTELTAAYKINKFIRVGGGYRYIQKPFLFSILEYDHRFSLDVALYYKVDKLNFRFRPRYQHRIRGITGDDGSRAKTYNRNKFSIEYNVNKQIALEFSYEFYLRLDAEGSFIDQNRYNLSFSYDINKKNNLSTFYMIQQEIQVTWPQLVHVTGLQYSYKF